MQIAICQCKTLWSSTNHWLPRLQIEKSDRVLNGYKVKFVWKSISMNHKGGKIVRRHFAVLCLISFTLFSGYGSVLVLQSSINIEGGIGVWSLMATYIGGTLFNLLFTPTVIRKMGARKIFTQRHTC